SAISPGHRLELISNLFLRKFVTGNFYSAKEINELVIEIILNTENEKERFELVYRYLSKFLQLNSLKKHHKYFQAKINQLLNFENPGYLARLYTLLIKILARLNEKKYLQIYINKVDKLFDKKEVSSREIEILLSYAVVLLQLNLSEPGNIALRKTL